MEIASLSIQNFMSIGRAAPIALSGKGLILIQGENEDDSSANSNGVGKSSIADGLCWALFGQTARGISGDSVVNKTAKKDCCVSVVLEDGDVCYRISRYRKDKTHKNQTMIQVWSKGETTHRNIEKGTEKETQALIASIVGCSHEVFMAAIYAGQEVTPDLPAMTDKNLKLLIEEASGTQRLEKAYEIARAEALDTSNRLAFARNQVVSAESNLLTLNTRLLDITRKQQEFEDQREGNAAGHKAEAQRVVAAIKQMVEQLSKLDRPALEAELAEINAKVSSIKPMQDKSQDMSRTHNAKLRDLSIANAGVTSKTNEAMKIKGALDNTEEAMKKPCETCGKPHTPEEIDQYRAHQSERLKEALRELQVAKSTAAEIEREANQYGSEMEAFNKTIPDLTDLIARGREIQRGLDEAVAIENSIAVRKKDAETHVERAKQAMTGANPHESASQTMTEQVAEQMGRIDELKESVKTLEAEQITRDDVVAVFSPAGVRAHILDTVTPFLNDRTAEYLATLSDGNITAIWTTLATTTKGDLKEKFSIEVSNDKGAESFAGLSGGEKRKVRLATMLALQDLVASRATKPINLWIGDEIDDALDSAGLERLMTILEKKARERGTVLIISHNELRDWCDQVLTVRKASGISTIEGEL